MDVSDGNLPSQSVLKGCPTPGKPGPYCFGTLGRRNLVDPRVDSAPILLTPRLALPPPPPQRPEAGEGTLVLVLDGEAEDVARPEAGAVIHAAVEKWVCVCVRDVQNLARGRHVARDALIRRDADLIALPVRGRSRES